MDSLVNGLSVAEMMKQANESDDEDRLQTRFTADGLVQVDKNGNVVGKVGGNEDDGTKRAKASAADRDTVLLAVGAKVYQNDVVQTADGGKLSLTFVDGTIFTLSSRSRMVKSRFGSDRVPIAQITSLMSVGSISSSTTTI